MAQVVRIFERKSLQEAESLAQQFLDAGLKVHVWSESPPSSVVTAHAEGSFVFGFFVEVCTISTRLDEQFFDLWNWQQQIERIAKESES